MAKGPEKNTANKALHTKSLNHKKSQIARRENGKSIAL